MFTMVLDTLLVFTITVPIVGWIAHKIGIEKLRDLYAFLALVVTACFLVPLYQEVERGTIVVVKLPAFLPPFGACLEIDMLSIFMAFTFLMLGIFASIYSIRYMERDTGLTEYYTLLLAMIAGMIGVVFAGDFFTFYIFWELMCLTSYVLVAFRKERWAPIEAGFKYLIMSSFGAMTLLLSMSLLYGMAGTLNFAILASIIRLREADPWLNVVLVTLIVGFGIKAALVPLHTWLPDAHPEAPSSISALLSGVLIQTGLYGLYRVLNLLFGPTFYEGLIVLLAVLTMTVGNFMALLQDDIKRLLAYSSIAQMGYMLIGLAVGTAVGLTGTFLHIFNHALLKGLAFLAAGAIWHESGTRSLKELEGAGRTMPVTTITLSISFFGLIGIPFTNGFISKFLYLFRSAIEANMVWLAVVGILNSVFSTAYYARTLQILVTRPAREVRKVKEAPLSMLAPMCVMAFLIILFGISPFVDPLLAFASGASNAFIDIPSYIKAILG